jgi:hypothetical protein
MEVTSAAKKSVPDTSNANALREACEMTHPMEHELLLTQKKVLEESLEGRRL